MVNFFSVCVLILGVAGSSFLFASAAPRRHFVKIDGQVDHQKPIGLTKGLGLLPVSTEFGIVATHKNKVGLYRLATWRLEWEQDISGALTTLPTLSPKGIILLTDEGFMSSLALENGAVQWTTKIPGVSVKAPVMASCGIVIHLANDQVNCYQTKDGQQVWSVDLNSTKELRVRSQTRPLVVGSQIYVGTSDGSLVELDSAAGKIKWRLAGQFSMSRFKGVIGQFALRGDVVSFASYDGYIKRVSLSQRKLIKQIKVAPILDFQQSGQRLVYTDRKRRMVGLDADFNEKWQTKLKDVVTAILIEDDVIIGIGSFGGVYRVEAATGRLVWEDFLDSELNPYAFVRQRVLYLSSALKNVYTYSL